MQEFFLWPKPNIWLFPVPSKSSHPKQPDQDEWDMNPDKPDKT